MRGARPPVDIRVLARGIVVGSCHETVNCTGRKKCAKGPLSYCWSCSGCKQMWNHLITEIYTEKIALCWKGVTPKTLLPQVNHASVNEGLPLSLQTQINATQRWLWQLGWPPTLLCVGPWWAEPHSSHVLQWWYPAPPSAPTAQGQPWTQQGHTVPLWRLQDPFQPLATIYNGHYLYYILIIYIYIYI